MASLLTYHQWITRSDLNPKEAGELLFFVIHPTTTLDTASWTMAHEQDRLTKLQLRRLEQLAKRRVKGEPLQYITNIAYFRDFSLYVDKQVLIPRPETEELVDLAIKHVLALHQPSSVSRPLTIVDVGTGSGAIAISLARWAAVANIPVHIIATDISKEALSIAQKNFENLLPEAGQSLAGKMKNLNFNYRLGYLLQPIKEPVDLIVANLPYIPTHWLGRIDTSVSHHEPRVALDGGPDGLDLIRQLLQDAPRILKPGGKIFLEIWHEHKTADLCSDKNYIVKMKKDSFNKDRFAIMTLKNSHCGST